MKRFIAEITLTTNDPSPGDTQTFYFSTKGFATKPTDTPPHTYVEERLKTPGTMNISLFSGNRVFGPVKPSYGEAVLFNTDAGLDGWTGFAAGGGKYILRYGDESAAYPAGYTTVFIATIHGLLINEIEVRLRLRDRLNLLDVPLVTESFQGTGGIDGISGSAGVLKQWVSGNLVLIPPVFMHPSKLMYYVQSTSPGANAANFKVYEGGIEIARGSDYASQFNLTCSSPLPGQCRFWFGPTGDGPVYFRLGSVPEFDIRVTCEGYQESGDDWTVADLAEVVGITGGVGTVPIGALLVDDSKTILEVCEEACKTQLGYFYMSPDDVFTSGIFSGPDVTAVATLTAHNAKNWQRMPITEMAAPVWRFITSAGKTYPGNSTAGATSAMLDYLSRDPWWISFSRSDDAVLLANPGAETAVIETDVRDFLTPERQDEFETLYFSLFGVPREYYTCEVPFPENAGDMDTLALNLTTTVEAKIPRFGLSAGKNFLIITRQIDSSHRIIKLGLWG